MKRRLNSQNQRHQESWFTHPSALHCSFSYTNVPSELVRELWGRGSGFPHNTNSSAKPQGSHCWFWIRPCRTYFVISHIWQRPCDLYVSTYRCLCVRCRRGNEQLHSRLVFSVDTPANPKASCSDTSKHFIVLSLTKGTANDYTQE